MSGVAITRGCCIMLRASRLDLVEEIWSMSGRVIIPSNRLSDITGMVRNPSSRKMDRTLVAGASTATVTGSGVITSSTGLTIIHLPVLLYTPHKRTFHPLLLGNQRRFHTLHRFQVLMFPCQNSLWYETFWHFPPGVQ